MYIYILYAIKVQFSSVLNIFLKQDFKRLNKNTSWHFCCGIHFSDEHAAIKVF